MKNLSDYIRKIAGDIKSEYHIEDIKIFFSAPNPKDPNSNTLTTKSPEEGANFQWIVYQVLFNKNDKYYIYDLSLKPSGEEKSSGNIFESDSNWSAKSIKSGNPTKDVSPGEIKTSFPNILKGPNLFPAKYGQTIYINIDKRDKKRTYSPEEFKKSFDNDFYVVLNPGKKELKNPLGKSIGMTYPKENKKC